VIDKLQSYYGLTTMPFGRALAPGMLHRHTSHAEAVTRIRWCVTERALGVITGEVGAGKTVAVRAALAALDASRHTIIYLGNPAVGGRGLYTSIITTLGGVPRFHKAALIPQTVELLTAEEHERGRTVILILDEAHLLSTDQLEETAPAHLMPTWTATHPSPRCWSANPPCADGSNWAPSPPSTNASPCATPSPA
jgi:type II secretory pathway predicted ATPase ExeA